MDSRRWGKLWESWVLRDSLRAFERLSLLLLFWPVHFFKCVLLLPERYLYIWSGTCGTTRQSVRTAVSFFDWSARCEFWTRRCDDIFRCDATRLSYSEARLRLRIPDISNGVIFASDSVTKPDRKLPAQSSRNIRSSSENSSYWAHNQHCPRKRKILRAICCYRTRHEALNNGCPSRSWRIENRAHFTPDRDTLSQLCCKSTIDKSRLGTRVRVSTEYLRQFSVRIFLSPFSGAFPTFYKTVNNQASYYIIVNPMTRLWIRPAHPEMLQYYFTMVDKRSYRYSFHRYIVTQLVSTAFR